MITAGEHIIKKIIAVNHDGIILPPCGRCREFLSQLANENMNTQIMVREDVVVSLKDLLPHDWRCALKKSKCRIE
jgi:cytidine deaminase